MSSIAVFTSAEGRPTGTGDFFEISLLEQKKMVLHDQLRGGESLSPVIEHCLLRRHACRGGDCRLK